MSKGLEYVRSELELSYDCLTTHDRVMLKQVEKELTALEIITNKVAFSRYDLECSETVEDYNITYLENSQLTQEEFVFLKDFFKEGLWV